MPLFETPTEPSPQHSDPSSEPQPPSQQPARIVAGRHGELDSHELIRLLDTIEDERARGRFRESLYISVFIWMIIAWVVFYGRGILWHGGKLKLPSDVLRDRELTELRLPPVPHLPAIKNTPPTPRPTIDRSTMNHLREMARQPAPAAALPNAPQPQPVAPSTPPPPPPPVATPTPRTPPPPVADAPTMQPAKPSFGTPSSAGNAIRNALNDAAHSRGGTDVGGGRPSRQGGPLNLGGAEVLSDTQGVDFGPYLRRILSDIKRNWDPLIPAEAEAPLYKQGESYIRFSINPDGTIKEMHLDGSTHDEAINRSCWGSITSEGQFPPLPSAFHGPNLELRIHYLVNKNAPE
jgi:outer membrane biosynthesis protein TonB